MNQNNFLQNQNQYRQMNMRFPMMNMLQRIPIQNNYSQFNQNSPNQQMYINLEIIKILNKKNLLIKFNKKKIAKFILFKTKYKNKKKNK